MSEKSKFQFDLLKQLEGEIIEVFLIDSGEKFTELKLEEVERSTTHGKRFDAFTVYLSGSMEPDQHCPQGNYILKNPAFGEECLFMTPNAQDQYHICISREACQVA